MFGQSTFGGGSSLFGASTTPSFGGSTFGAPASTAPTSTFTFGAPAPSTGAPAFGASTPSFGGAAAAPSMFGAPAASSTPSFGGGSLFGAPAATTGGTSLFGAPASQPAAATSGGAFPFSFSGGAAAPAAAPATGSAFSFGGASSTPAFGAAAPATGAFGAPAPAAGTSSFGGMFGAPTGGMGGVGGGVQGTTIAPYAPTNDKDTTNNANVTIHNISAMPQYKDKSFDELRWEDYQLGRKGQGMGQQASMGGGMFGSAAPAAGSSLFGATTGSAFSTTPAPSAGTSLFGAPAASSSLFGGGASTGSSLFGASAPASTGSSLFGAPAASTGTSLFGATTSAPTTSSLFGGGATTSAFGAPTGSAPTSSLFPSFTGSTAAPASSAFSFGGATAPAASSTGSLFGATAPSTSLFGATTSDTSSSLFGGGGGTSSLFGGAGTGAAPTSTSLFGGGAATGSSLFGSTAPASTGGGLFGAPAASSATSSGGLFGGSSLFGATPSTPSATTGFPSLGSFGTGTSSFGATGASTGSSLFGGASSGSSLFPAFGSTTPGQTPLMGTMGGMLGGGAATPSLVATIDSPRPYGSLPPLPTFADSDAALASAAQTRAAQKPKHYKLTARSPAAGRSLGYYQNLGGASKRISFMGEIERKDQPSPLSASTPDVFTRRKLILETDENVAMPEIAEFRATPQSDRLMDRRANELPPATPYVGAPEHDKTGPGTPQATGERERTAPAIQITTPSGRAIEPATTPARLYPTLSPHEITKQQSQQAADTPLPARTPKKPIVERRLGQVVDYDKPEAKRFVSDYEEFYRVVRDQDRKKAPPGGWDQETEALMPTLTEPGYWMQPSLDELRHMSKDDLAHVENLVVGREGYGQVEFLDPVDLRGVDLNQLIVIDRHLITVFPDDATKPPRGHGLNVRARLTIEEAWPEHKDPQSLEEYEAFLRKRGSRRKQRFVSYDRHRGAWTFDVPGF